MESPHTFAVQLSVSVVLHNSTMPLLLHCLQTLQAAAECARRNIPGSQVSVYLVDNCSAPTYREQLEEQVQGWPQDTFFQLHYRPQPDNRGFGYGHNLVIPSLHSDYHLVLNPDTELRKEALLEGLSRLAGDDSIVMLSPRVYGSAGEQEFLCKRYPTVLVLLLRGFAPAFVRRMFQERLSLYEMRDQCSGDNPVDIEIASGCFMLLRTSALRAVGGFNENFFLYFEDFDFSLRLSRQGRLVYHPSVEIVHHGGYAAKKGLRHLRYFISSGVQFFNRHGWRWI